jgi:formyl-CoA transferase/CoA:oxalate CoA-transferase
MPFSEPTDAAAVAALGSIRVIELGRVLAAPYCGQLLGDAGADVIKIEIPGEGDESRTYGPPFVDGQSYYFLSLNRNKRSVTLNLKHAAARDLLLTLISTADVFLHNSLPSTTERFGLNYDTVQQVNPRIIYCAISGFGQAGPDRDRPGLDMMAQAESGIMNLTGEPNGPPMRAGVPIADLAAGMLAAYGISLALLQRQRTGRGQMVDTSLLEASLSLVSYQTVRHLLTGESPQRLGNAHPSIVPYDTYRCADGWISIAVVNYGIWQRFCTALELQELAMDPRFIENPSRIRNRTELDTIIKNTLEPRGIAELVPRLRNGGVPYAEVRDVAAAVSGPQAQALGLVQPSTHPGHGAVQLLAPPIHLSASAADERFAPPYLGEHTDEILRELGLAPEKIDQLRADGAI